MRAQASYTITAVKDGNDLDSILMLWKKTTTNAAPAKPSGTNLNGWTEDMPEFESGAYVWTCNRVAISDPTAATPIYTYTDPVLDTHWKKLDDLGTKYAEVKSTADEAYMKAGQNGEDIAVLKVTTDGLNSTVTGQGQKLTNIEQTVNNITLTVVNPDGVETSIKLSDGKLDMTGLVTFTDLSTQGKTTINGSNITTGAINAELINLVEMSGLGEEEGAINYFKLHDGRIEVQKLYADGYGGDVGKIILSGGEIDFYSSYFINNDFTGTDELQIRIGIVGEYSPYFKTLFYGVDGDNVEGIIGSIGKEGTSEHDVLMIAAENTTLSMFASGTYGYVDISAARDINLQGRNIFIHGNTVKSANNTNFNNLTTSGWYYGYTGMSNAAAQSISVTEVIPYSVDWIVQRQTVISGTPITYERHRHSGTTWSSWIPKPNEKSYVMVDDLGYQRQILSNYLSSGGTNHLVFGPDESSFYTVIRGGELDIRAGRAMYLMPYYGGGYGTILIGAQSTDRGLELKPHTNNTCSLGWSSGRWKYLYVNKIYTTNSVSVDSDKRLKKDISYDLSSLDKVIDLIKPATYKLIADDEELIRFGFIAQDAEQAFIDAGLNPDDYAFISKDETENGVMLSLGYTETNALLWHRQQQLEQRIAELEKRIA